jgi:putative ABC transport system permease protein
MVSSFLKIAWRNIVKHKTFSLINIFVLAIGLACFLLITLYVADELSFDRYHDKADRIYRVNSNIIFGGAEMKIGVCSDPMGATLKKDYPEVEQFTRIYNSDGSKQIKKGNEYITEDAVAYADSTFFEVFTFKAISGELQQALNEPNTVVISESSALKYFGRTNVVGETIETEAGSGKLFKVTAVIKDMPNNGHFRFDFIFSMDNVNYDFGNYISHNFYTYIFLKPGTLPGEFEKHFKEVIERYVFPQASHIMQLKSMDEFEKAGNKLEYSLMPITDIHLKSDRFPELAPVGNIRYIYTFGAVALFILLLACVNFINLSTANSGSRAREIGIRKVLGSEKSVLVGQFLSESVLTSFIATIFALLLVWACLDLFNDVSAKELSMLDLLKPTPLILISLLSIVTGLVAGSYPAFYIAAFQPIAALKGRLKLSSHKSYFRNALVVFQFSTAIMLIIGTVVVYKQLSFIRNKNLGYHKEQILLIDDTYVLGNNYEAFKKSINALNGVKTTASAGYLPVSGSSRSDNTFSTDATMTTENSFNMQNWSLDYDYIPLLGIEFIQGRNFSREFGTDSLGLVINETCAKMLGGGNVIGKKIYTSSDGKTMDRVYTIIGVVKNFNFESLRQEVGPLSMRLGNANWTTAVKLSSGDIPGLIAGIEKLFKSMASGKPFSYRFLDDAFEDMYRTEQRIGKLALTFSVLAIFIACLGLFGLATYMAQQRVKEIGVRKVLGASVFNIVQMLSSDFIKLVALSAVISFPLSWWAMHSWLQDFAFRTTLNWWVFALAGLTGLIIALATISFQAIRAAIANPVKSLRNE